MNARNLKYIKTKNTGESVSLADSKLKTKNFLSVRGIPFAETYATIDTHHELNNFSFDSLTENNFVIKPNHGSKGQGILIVKKNKNNTFNISGETWTEDDIRLHMTDMLGGAFSLYGNHDRVVIEELMTPGRDFAKYCRHGLADIRMIVYNYVPITAMVRMPTELSGGKANLAQGWIGLGLNIATGRITSYYQYKKNYTETFPSPYEHLKWAKIPYWDDILLYSSQIQFHTGLGYLALDWVITKNWPKLLEINARAGLEIQNVNLVPLSKRLEQVNSLKVKTPEKWVEIAKTIFNTDISVSVGGKKIINSSQKINYRWCELNILVDMFAPKTIFSSDLKKKFSKKTTLIFNSNTELEILPAEEFGFNLEKNTIILGQDNLVNCLVMPVISTNSTNSNEEKNQNSQFFSPKIHSIDSKLSKIGKKLWLTFLSRPLNYTTELEKFLEHPHQYNPIFEYNFPNEEKIESIKTAIWDVNSDIENLDEEEDFFKKIFSEKLDEYCDILGLILAYKSQNFDDIYKYNTKLFGEFDTNLLKLSAQKVLDNAIIDDNKKDKILGPILTIDEIISEINIYFEENNLEKVEIKISEKTLSRIAIAYNRDSAQINISPDAIIRKNEIKAILTHEIGTHLKRFQEWKKKWLDIFAYWTGYYLIDEEWLAIYNSLEFLPEDYEKNSMYVKYYILSKAEILSFNQLTKLIQSIYPHHSLQKIFKIAFRIKRWLVNTGITDTLGTVYKKDKIYLDWFEKISNFVNSGWKIEDLYFGKIKIDDLNNVLKIKI